MIIADLHKLFNDIIRRGGSVNEKEIVMGDAFLNEESFVVLFFVQSHDSLDIKLLEYVDILVRVMSISLVSVSLLNRAHECHEFPGNNPVKIAIFDSLVLLILLDVEGSEVIPFEFDGILESLQALEQSTLVEAVSLRGISVGFEKLLIGLEDLICLFSRALKDDNHETAHEECSINHFLRLFRSTVVENPVVSIVLVSEQPC